MSGELHYDTGKHTAWLDFPKEIDCDGGEGQTVDGKRTKRLKPHILSLLEQNVETGSLLITVELMRTGLDLRRVLAARIGTPSMALVCSSSSVFQAPNTGVDSKDEKILNKKM